MSASPCVVCGESCEPNKECGLMVCDACYDILDGMASVGLDVTFLAKNWWWLQDLTTFYGTIPETFKDCFGEFHAVIREGEIDVARFTLSKVKPARKASQSDSTALKKSETIPPKTRKI